MTSPYDRVKLVFQEALDRPAGALRAAYLDAECAGDDELRAEVDDLLGLHSTDGERFERDFAGTRALPETIGPYSIVRRLGEGGMGTVFEAQQENPRRRVALKLLRGALASESLLRRFELEGHLLGRLHHPGIAQIHDAGTTDAAAPEPWFVMELVLGAPLIRHADEQALGVRARIELLLRVADAVEHAHQRGVIHRDLKPDNILVGEDGQPKVLDFGIARTVEDEQATRAARTRTGQLVGTLAYMSPEQAAGDAEIDTRTDVYALGALLYELLAGRPPLELKELPLSDALRAIQEKDPPPLGALDRELRGDLEIVAARATAKEREQRYPSVRAFADDLRRFLADEPIVARRATRIYQIKKFTRRHRALVAAAGAVALAVLTGLVVSTRLYLIAEKSRVEAVRAGERERAQRVEAQTQRTVAQRRAAQAEAVTTFLIEALAQADPRTNVEARELTVRAMLDEAARGVGTAFPGEPGSEAAVRATIASAYLTLGERQRALEHARRALELQRATRPEGDDEQARTLGVIALARIERAELDAAREALEAARELLSRLHPDTPHHPLVLWCAELEGMRALAAGDLEGARAAFDGALELLEAGELDDPGTRAEVLNNLAVVERQGGDLHAARELLERALPLVAEAFGDRHPEVAVTLNNTGIVSFQLGDRGRAEECLRGALAIRRETLGERHAAVAESLHNLASILEAGSPEKVQLYAQALEIDRERLGPGHPSVATILNNMGVGLRALGRFDEAEACYLEALELRREALGPDHPDIAASLHNLGVLFEARGEPERALPYAEECLEMRALVLPPEDPLIALSERFLNSLHDALAE